MGLLDTARVPEGAKKTEATTSSILDRVKVPESRARGFEINSMRFESQVAKANADYRNSFRGLAAGTATDLVTRPKGWTDVKNFGRGFVEGYKETPKEEKTIGSITEGKLVSTGGKVVADSIDDAAARIQTAYLDWTKQGVGRRNKTALDTAVSTGQAGLGLINVLFSPITGTMMGASTLPGVGHAADVINGVFGGIAKGSGNVAVGELERSPFLSDEAKEKLKPLVEETAGLAGQLIAGKAGHSAYTRTKANVDTMLETFKQEALGGQYAVDYMGNPARFLPVESTGGTTRIQLSTPTTRYLEYRQKMGYEGYTPDSNLPVIEWGDGRRTGGRDSNLPVIDITEPGKTKATPEPVGKSKTDELPIQEKPATEVVPIKEESPYNPKLEEKIIEREILTDTIKNDPARNLMKYRGKGDNTLAEQMVRAEGTTKKSSDLDGITKDLGYADLADAQRGLDNYIAAKERLAEINQEIKDMRANPPEPDVYDATKVDVQESTNIQSVDSMVGEPGGTPIATEAKGTLPAPVTAEGPIRQSKLASRLEDNIRTSLGDKQNYNQVNFAEQGRLGASFVETNWGAAKEIAMGNMATPDGLLFTTVYEAVRLKAEAVGDTATITALTESKMHGSATRMGQEIAYLRENADNYSATNIIKDINDSLAAEIQAKTGKSVTEAVNKETSTIKGEIDKQMNNMKSWQDFLKDIQC